jgi:hypothetical protein
MQVASDLIVGEFGPPGSNLPIMNLSEKMGHEPAVPTSLFFVYV